MFEQEAIRVLEMQYKDAKDSYSLHGEHCANAITVAIEALEKQKNDGWIPVTERLPEDLEIHQVTVIKGLADRRGLDYAYLVATTKKWIDCEGEYIDNVIAWKENPEPYKGKQMEKSRANKQNRLKAQLNPQKKDI